MKKLAIIFAALLAVMVSCTNDFDLSSYDQRLAELERTVEILSNAQNGGDYITDVTELKDAAGNVVGYQVTFKDHGTVVVRNGSNGDNGTDGTTWKIENGTWWKNEGNGFEDTGIKAVGEDGVGTPGADGDSFFKSVTVEDGFVTFVLEDGRTFTVSVLPSSVADYQLAAKGDGETLTTTLGTEAPVTAVAPEWATVTVEGKTVSIAVAANPDEKNARMGKITLNVDDGGVIAKHEILLAQAAKGCNIVFDSFAGTVLDENWKGDIAASGANLNNGSLAIHGHADWMDRLYPLFWTGAKIRRQASDDSYNTIICTVDIKADGGEGGIQLFNTNGYDGNAYNFDMPNYRYFTSAGAGSTGGGFYGFNKGGLAAADGWNCAVGTVTDWIRLEISNIDRGKTEHSLNPDWGAAYIWSLEPDENGVLQPKDILWAKELWWWNDGDNQPRKDYGYAAVWGRSVNVVSLKNFTLSYTDK